jgi:hypothetical protein
MAPQELLLSGQSDSQAGASTGKRGRRYLLLGSGLILVAVAGGVFLSGVLKPAPAHAPLAASAPLASIPVQQLPPGTGLPSSQSGPVPAVSTHAAPPVSASAATASAPASIPAASASAPLGSAAQPVAGKKNGHKNKSKIKDPAGSGSQLDQIRSQKQKLMEQMGLTSGN